MHAKNHFSDTLSVCPRNFHVHETFMSTKLSDSLKKDGFPKELAIEPTVTTAIFKDMPVKSRLEFYGEFLANLEAWQQKAMWQQQRFPFDFAWPEPLGGAVQIYKESKAPRQA
jgi:hypothetical protein